MKRAPFMVITGLPEHTQKGRPRDDVDLYVFVPGAWQFGRIYDVDTKAGVALVEYYEPLANGDTMSEVYFESLYPCERA